MKGFPNQISTLTTLSSALEVLVDLINKGQDPKDDGVFGEALVTKGILGTGHTKKPIAEYLAQQKTKPVPNQSIRTSSRGLRELFRVLGLIDDSTNQIKITIKGETISKFANKFNSPNFISEWRTIIFDMSHDGGDNQLSHPYQVLLKLVEKHPGISRAKCALALEAKNDSESELNRIFELSKQDENSIIQKIGTTQSNWDNAKKILPSFAEQLRDVRSESGKYYLQSTLPSGNANDQIDIITKVFSPKSIRKVTSKNIASAGTSEIIDKGKPLPEINLDTIAAGKERLLDRRKRHNLLVLKIAKMLESRMASLYADPVDCLAVFNAENLLIEVKSIEKELDDEIDQVRDALSQLLYYEFFVIDSTINSHKTIKVAYFEFKISDELIRWLEKFDICVIWDAKPNFDGAKHAKNQLKQYLSF